MVDVGFLRELAAALGYHAPEAELARLDVDAESRTVRIYLVGVPREARATLAGAPDAIQRRLTDALPEGWEVEVLHRLEA